MKKVLYTCITGGYDNVPEYKYIAPDWEYVLFTDNADLIQAGKIHHWTVRPLVFNYLDNVRNARWHKINAHILFPDYDYSLWLDGNISIVRKKAFTIADKFIHKNTLVAVPLHLFRNCIYQEAKEIINLSIDYKRVVNAEIKCLRKHNYPENNGLHETCILLRKHDNIINALNQWWHMVAKYSKRDQLSFDYAMWANDVKITPFYDDKGAGTHHYGGDFSFMYPPKHDQAKIKRNKFKLLEKKCMPSGRVHVKICGIKCFSFKRKVSAIDTELERYSSMMATKPKLLVYTYANAKYYDFAILYPIWVLTSNKDACVEIALENQHAFYKKYSHLVNYYNKAFPGRVKFTQIPKKFLSVPAGTIRFISRPTTVADYVYIGDIDILVLYDIYKLHIANIKRNKLDFSNIKRKGADLLSGLHFIKYDRMYPVILDNIDIKHDIDENVLYKLMKNKKYKIPDENTQAFRPLCGIHISYFSRPPLKTLTTNDTETDFPFWYDNCNNEKISDEITEYTKIRNSKNILQFYAQIHKTDVDLRRIIQIIDLFIFYLQHNQKYLKK